MAKFSVASSSSFFLSCTFARFVTSSPHLASSSSEVRFPFHPPSLPGSSLSQAAAQVSRASLRVGPTLGPHSRQ
ncbi:MAG: hypothetical protein MW690_000796 [Methanophagales archaeon]|nr:hypothetical protein [Methanophagales archaeon]